MHLAKKNEFKQKEVNCMNILVAVNEAYLNPLSVMLYSLQFHNPCFLNVYILHLKIPQNTQQAFCKKISKWRKRIELCFLKVNSDAINKNIKYGRFGAEAVLRLAILKVLPLSVDRVLWMDADIIVRGNIRKFYQFTNYGQYALVCEDMFPKKEKHELFSKLGLKMTDKYFNSGVMLFYLDNLRKDFNENEFLQWMNDNQDKLNYPDQNALNLCLKKKLYWAKPEIYNLQLLRVTASMRESGIINKCRILHYNTKEKPWDDYYIGLCASEFWKYGIRVLGIKKYLEHYCKKWLGFKR